MMHIRDCRTSTLLKQTLALALALVDIVASVDVVELPEGTKLKFSQKIGGFDPPEKEAECMPLFENDWPISHETYECLQYSDSHSIVMPNDYEVEDYEIGVLVAEAGGPPLHAPDPDFWPLFDHVVDAQIHRRSALDSNGESVVARSNEGGILWLPELWKTFTLEEVAEAVHDEFPGYNQAHLIESLAKEGIQPDNDIIPKRCQAQFLHGIVLWARMLTWAINEVAPKNFGSKWWAGRARPEEVAWSIKCTFDLDENCEGAIVFKRSDVPDHIRDKILSMDLKRRQDFTAYPEGSPMHPSWPAMHSAASSASAWLPIVAHLTPEQIDEVKKMDLAVSYARTVAGVHYADDNTVGLTMGKHIVMEKLPGYLEEEFGADPEKVKAKMAKFDFDWVETADRIMKGQSTSDS